MIMQYVTGFDKSWLPHTQWQSWLFTTTQFLHQWTNNPCVSLPMVPWSVFLGLVSHACLMFSSAWVVFKWQWCELARKHGHQTGYYLWYLELKLASGETIWQCQLLHVEKPATSVVPHYLDLHPYMIICDSGIKLSKMVGNSASCLLKSWSTERHCITMD